MDIINTLESTVSTIANSKKIIDTITEGKNTASPQPATGVVSTITGAAQTVLGSINSVLSSGGQSNASMDDIGKATDLLGKAADIVTSGKITDFSFLDDMVESGKQAIKNLMPSLDIFNKDFIFLCGGLDPVTFNVARFEGTDALSVPYHFDITLTSKRNDINGDDVVNKPASLFIKRIVDYRPYSGIVTSFRYIETTVDHSTYRATLQPSLWTLSLTSQSRVFQKKSVTTIIEDVLKEAGLQMYYTLNAQQYPEREYVVQYQESDLNFISRLMEEAGLWYMFVENPVPPVVSSLFPSMEKLLITDKPSNFRDIPINPTIRYCARTDMVEQIGFVKMESIYAMESERSLIPGEVTVKSYNYRTPEIDLSLSQPVTGGDKGKVYTYGGGYKDTMGAQKAAQVISRRFSTRKNTIVASGNCAGLRAGARFTLEEHRRPDFNASFIVTKITHTGADPDFDPLVKKKAYDNEATCITAMQAEQYAPECITPAPKIPGIMTALVEATSSDYATIDDKGRYKIRMPFDMSDAQKSQASKYVRLAQHYSGADYGIHFPAHEGSEMIIGHIDGDPDKPVGLGTVPNANTISPVKDSNHTVSVIRTAGKNEMIYDDTSGSEKITIHTPRDLVINADNDETLTVKNNRSKTVEKDETGTVKGNCTITIDKNYDQTVKKDKTIAVDGKHTETIKGNTTIKISDGDMIHEVGTGKATYDVNGDYTMRSEAKMYLCAKKPASVVAETIDLMADREITLKTGKSTLKLKNDGTIELNGMKIGFTSMDLALKGTSSVTIAGASITSAAMADHNISGQIVKSEGAATNIIKGGMVMLNP